MSNKFLISAFRQIPLMTGGKEAKIYRQNILLFFILKIQVFIKKIFQPFLVLIRIKLEYKSIIHY